MVSQRIDPYFVEARNRGKSRNRAKLDRFISIVVYTALVYAAGYALGYLQAPDKKPLSMEEFSGKMVHRYNFSEPGTGAMIGEVVVIYGED